MRVIINVYLILALMTITIASATIVKHDVGPYTVSLNLTNTSLELNSSASKWGDPLSEENTGYAEGAVRVVLKDRPSYDAARITVMESGSGIVSVDPAGDAQQKNLEAGGWVNIQRYTRAIDGDRRATIVTADNPDPRGESICWVIYRLNGNVLVDIKSRIPMGKGTSDLLDTIHVSEKSAAVKNV